MEATKAIKFSFDVTNNIAEYEALTAGLKQARKVGVRNLKAPSDSQLVVRLMTEDYAAKYPTLAKYDDLVKKLIKEFDLAHIENVHRRDNAEVTPWPSPKNPPWC